jgi:hypothetical protein
VRPAGGAKFIAYERARSGLRERRVRGLHPFIQLRRGGGEEEELLFPPVPANLSHLRIVASICQLPRITSPGMSAGLTRAGLRDDQPAAGPGLEFAS